MDQLKELKMCISTKDIYRMKEVLPTELIISQEVRDACIKNKCGQYGNNFMCPPHIGEIQAFKEKLKQYHNGIFVLVKDEVDNPSDLNEFYKSADLLHRIMIDIEKKAKELGYKEAAALIGGNCKLCKPCNAKLGKENCAYPHLARTSLEAVGIDVIHSCEKKGITIEFKEDEVTWVGLLLI